MPDPIKPWSTRLVEFGVSVLAVALMLHWAWALLRPLVPVITTVVLLIAGVLCISAATRWAILRWRGW